MVQYSSAGSGAVVCGVWCGVCTPQTSPTSLHHARPEDQEDGRELSTRFISLHPSLPPSQPPSLPPLPSLIKYLVKIGKLQVNSSVSESSLRTCPRSSFKLWTPRPCQSKSLGIKSKSSESFLLNIEKHVRFDQMSVLVWWTGTLFSGKKWISWKVWTNL